MNNDKYSTYTQIWPTYKVLGKLASSLSQCQDSEQNRHMRLPLSKRDTVHISTNSLYMVYLIN